MRKRGDYMIKIKVFKTEPKIDERKNFEETGSYRNNKFAMDLYKKTIKKLEAFEETKK